MEQLSLETVIIVACVCGTVVLVLTIVLIVLCCQKNHEKDFYEKTETYIGNTLDCPTSVNEYQLKQVQGTASGVRSPPPPPSSSVAIKLANNVDSQSPISTPVSAHHIRPTTSNSCSLTPEVAENVGSQSCSDNFSPTSLNRSAQTKTQNINVAFDDDRNDDANNGPDDICASSLGKRQKKVIYEVVV